MGNANKYTHWIRGEAPGRGFLKRVAVSIAVIILAGLLTACAPPKKAEDVLGVPGVNEVWLIGWVYEPETMTVPVGTTISWNNTTRDYHTVTSDDGLFDSRMGGGQSFSYTFNMPGTFAYHDGATDPPTTGKVVVK